MWIGLTLLTAVCTAARDVASKRAVRHSDPLLVAFGIALVPAVALGAVTLGPTVLSGGMPTIGPGFITALVISGAINALATPLIVVALQRSDLSLVAPVTSLTPVFMIGTGVVVLGEMPGPAGVFGILVIVAGAYLLSVSERHLGLLAPFRALMRDPGTRVMLLVAFLYSISASYDKVGTAASSPLAWAASIHTVTAVVLGPLVVWRWRARRASGDASTAASFTPTPLILLAGVVTAVGAAAQMTAIMLTLAAYVIAVKRTSTLFGVLLGRSVFGEGRTGERLLGAAVMLAGFVLVTTA